jgi:hypothetical protein
MTKRISADNRYNCISISSYLYLSLAFYVLWCSHEVLIAGLVLKTDCRNRMLIFHATGTFKNHNIFQKNMFARQLEGATTPQKHFADTQKLFTHPDVCCYTTTMLWHYPLSPSKMISHHVLKPSSISLSFMNSHMPIFLSCIHLFSFFSSFFLVNKTI